MTAVNKYVDDGGLDFKAVIANLIQEFDTAFHGKVFRFSVHFFLRGPYFRWKTTSPIVLTSPLASTQR